MGQIGAYIFLITIFFVGKIDFIQALVIGAFAFILSLIVSRFFERIIDSAVKRIVNFLQRHSRIENLILKYF